MSKPKCFAKSLENDFITYVDSDELPDELFKWLAQYNLKISNVIEGFYTKPKGGAIPIHNDTVIPPGQRDACKLNFTWGPDTSTTRWYKLKEDKKYIEVNHDETEINKSFENLPGQKMSRLFKTGDRTYCFIGIWESEEAIAAQRENMIGNLDKVRHLLEELSPELGVTDPVSGTVVLDYS